MADTTTTPTPTLAARKAAFITATARQYRADAAAQGIKEVTEDAWSRIMQARMQAIYGTVAQ